MNALHPRVRVRWILSGLIGAAVVGTVLTVVDRFVLDAFGLLGAVVAAVITPLVVGHAVLRYRSWRYELQGDALELERGVLTRVETAVPYVRIQHVDTQRGPVDRLLGLSSVVVYTAGSRGADVTIPGLLPDDARTLRDRLRDLAVESEPEDAV